MNLRYVAIILVAVIVVEALAIGYMALNNNQLSETLSQLQSEYRKLQSEYQALVGEYRQFTTAIYPLTLIDDANRVITISSEPLRIVSLAPSITEILFTLNLSDRVLGVTMFCDYPPIVNEMKEKGRLTVIGGYWDPDAEKIIGLRPDLVIGYASVSPHVDLAERLTALNITVMLLYPHNLHEVFNNIILIGKATGKLVEAQKLVQQLEARVNSTIEKIKNLPKIKVYYEIWFDPIWTTGPGTFIDELISLAGGINVFGDAKTMGVVVSYEDVVNRNPDVIVLPDTYMKEFSISKEQVISRPGWSAINAVKNDRIYFIDEDIVVRPGPRLVEGLEVLARLIHPEAFGG
ncbi:MAG: cobalamin-binding protein [Candidatus Nezhaarchaeales archaeon]